MKKSAEEYPAEQNQKQLAEQAEQTKDKKKKHKKSSTQPVQQEEPVKVENIQEKFARLKEEATRAGLKEDEVQRLYSDLGDVNKILTYLELYPLVKKYNEINPTKPIKIKEKMTEYENEGKSGDELIFYVKNAIKVKYDDSFNTIREKYNKATNNRLGNTDIKNKYNNAFEAKKAMIFNLKAEKYMKTYNQPIPEDLVLKWAGYDLDRANT